MSILRTTAAILIGLIIGSIINMGLIVTGSTVIPIPEGVDPSNAESIAASIHLYEARHFVFPFLAHSLGALVGSLISYLVSGEHKTLSAYVVGGVFLLGGISAAFMIPAPLWFIVADLLLAYLPMAFIASKIGASFHAKTGHDGIENLD